MALESKNSALPLPDHGKPGEMPTQRDCVGFGVVELGDWPRIQPRDYGLDWLEARDLFGGIRVFPNKSLKTVPAG